MTMADRIVVMKDGHIQQVDTPQNLYDRPVNMFVAGFIGAPQMNMLPSTILRRGDGYVAVFDGRELPLPAHFDKSRIAPYEGRELVLGIRPENFHELPPADIAPENLAPLKAVVELAEPMGSEVHLNMVAGGRNLIARVSPRYRPDIGEEATLVADMTNAQLFDKETERSILY
jgi:multiple sugar transport system ATP-binding protein